jgi:carbonic anhydrase
MKTLARLFRNNREWAARVTAQRPDFFGDLARIQRPGYLWIGCSDSRVPANEIVGLPPGELFVHRNVANVVVHTDLNCLSVLQFAVDGLHVPHVIVCGHDGCTGVRAAFRDERLGLAENWLRHVQDVRDRHAANLATLASEEASVDRLCALNVLEQVVNVCRTTTLQDAWRRGQAVSVHGWIYALGDGLLQDLGLTVSGPDELEAGYETAVRRVTESERAHPPVP